eukprot:gene23883-biopygen19371
MTRTGASRAQQRLPARTAPPPYRAVRRRASLAPCRHMPQQMAPGVTGRAPQNQSTKKEVCILNLVPVSALLSLDKRHTACIRAVPILMERMGGGRWAGGRRGHTSTRARRANGRGNHTNEQLRSAARRELLGSQDTGAGVARAWRGRGADYRPFCGLGGAGVARAWRGRGAGMSCDPREYRCSIAEVHKRRAPTRGGERALNPGNAAGRCILECVK